MLRTVSATLQQLAATYSTCNPLALIGHRTCAVIPEYVLQRPYAKLPSYPSPPVPHVSSNQKGVDPVHRHVIYKGKWIIPVRFLVRGKVFQFMGMLGVASAAFSMRMVRFTTHTVFI
jgi:hypothetical protein